MELLIKCIMLAAFWAVLLNSKPYNWIREGLGITAEFTRCCMCTGFWFGIVISGFMAHSAMEALMISGTISFTAEWIDRKLNS
jgi:hypothetical protein